MIRTHRRALAAALCLTLAWPTPAVALRPAGLEENNTKQAVAARLAATDALAALSERPHVSWREAHSRILRGLDQHPGGRFEAKPFADGLELSQGDLIAHKLFTHLIPAQTAKRLRENVGRRVHDQPLVRLIVMDSRTALRDALQFLAGGYWLNKEIAALIGIHPNNLSPSGSLNVYPFIKDENRRRFLATAARRRLGLNPIQRIATTPTEAIDFAIQDHPGGPTTSREFARFANIPHWNLQHAHYPARLAAGNAQRARQQRPPIVIVPPPYHPPAFRARPRAAGLEEGQVGPRGVVVIPAAALDRVEGLPGLLDRLPDNLARQILIWLETGTVLKIQQTRAQQGLKPILTLRRGSAGELAAYVDWFLDGYDFERVGILSDDWASVHEFDVRLSALRTFAQKADVKVEQIPEPNLTWLLKMLGVPEAVSQQVGLEELMGERYALSGT